MDAKSVPHRRLPAPRGADINVAASTRDICFLLLVFAVAMGFTHQFGYMQRLGSEMELAEQPIPHLAVDALMVISDNAWLYGGAVLLAIGTLVFWSVARRHGWVTMRESESTIITLIAFTGILSTLSYCNGREEAAHFYQIAYAGHDHHAREIFVPAQAITPQQCYASRAAANATVTPSTANATRERWYLTAESSSRYHVIRQTIAIGDEAPLVEPMVIEAGMLRCFQQLQPSSPPPALATQSPDGDMLATPGPGANTVARAGGHRQAATSGVQ